MKSSRQDLVINMAFDRYIFKGSQITLFLWFTFIPKTAMGLTKTGDSFYCATWVSLG